MVGFIKLNEVVLLLCIHATLRCFKCLWFNLNSNLKNSSSNLTTTLKQCKGSKSATHNQLHFNFFLNSNKLYLFLLNSLWRTENVAKILKLWENCLFIFIFNHVLKYKNFRVWHWESKCVCIGRVTNLLQWTGTYL